MLQCMKKYIEVMVYDGNIFAISCPDANCEKNGIITKDEVDNCKNPLNLEDFCSNLFELLGDW